MQVIFNTYFVSTVFQNSAPMLVPLAEEGETKNAGQFIEKYLEPFKNKKLERFLKCFWRAQQAW